MHIAPFYILMLTAASLKEAVKYPILTFPYKYLRELYVGTEKEILGKYSEKSLTANIYGKQLGATQACLQQQKKK